MLSKEEFNILRLIRSRGVGFHTFFKILNFFGSYEDSINNINEFNKRYKLKTPITISAKEEIEREIVGCSTIGAKIITYKNEKYPKMLRKISDFPPVITALGNEELLNINSIAIVGSRNASSNGCNFAKKLARELGEAGYVITSGFASGIDTHAHMGAIDSGTIAVLGGGVDDIYPKGNESLYYEIKNKGLIISEIPLNSAPRAENFPARNRIVSGLSQALVIIEAGSRSGTIHTARQAVEQGRELLVAPGDPYSPRAEGSNKLLKDGATVITSTEDVLYALDSFSSELKNSKSLKLEENLKTNFNNYVQDDTEDIISSENSENNTSNIKELIISKLNYTPIEIQLLEENLQIPTNVINSNLIELELQGAIVIEQGGVRLK